MASNNNEGFEFNESIDKAEHYVRDNKKSLGIIFGAGLAILAAYFGYTTFIVKPQEEKAQKEKMRCHRGQ